MSVMKYKDASGNWVETTEIMCGGQLKVDIIQRTSETTYDLRKYAGRRFLLYYTANQVYSLFDSTQPDGIRYRVYNDADTWSFGIETVFGAGGNNRPLATEENENAYTYENGIFTWKLGNEPKVGQSALVIYAE